MGPTSYPEAFPDGPWDLWEHHNGILHNDILPKEETARHLLDQTIQEEYFLGIQALWQKHWHHFIWTQQCELLLKPLSFKKRQLLNVETANN
jgi:hypothetical protein